MIAYAVKNKDTNIRKQSSSGGVFTLLAEDMIEQGGVVIGASFEGIDLKHIKVDTKEELHKLRGSKYTESTVDYHELRDDRPTLFSGTPCQIPANADLKVEVVCHGTPKREIFEQYCREKEITKINFRDKTNGWNNYNVVIESNEQATTMPFIQNEYMRAFIYNLILNDKCYNCQFKNRSNADITLGDFWGIQNEYPEFADDIGVSVVIIRTDKGKQAFDRIKDKVEYIEVDINKAIKYNPSINTSSKPHPRKEEFDKSTGTIEERVRNVI
jgi:coenzyme F420-reducing hydrogenase beta subunit